MFSVFLCIRANILIESPTRGSLFCNRGFTHTQRGFILRDGGAFVFTTSRAACSLCSALYLRSPAMAMPTYPPCVPMTSRNHFLRLLFIF